MSLYADEDLTLATAPDPSSSTPSNPLEAFTTAITLPAESPQQAQALILAAQKFEDHPESLPAICGQLLPMVVDGGESLLRGWTLEMVGLAVGRSRLEGEVKISVAQSSLEALNKLLHSNSIPTIKAVIPIFSTIYPILFKLLATSRPPQQIHDLFLSSKTRIISLILDPSAQLQNVGIKAAAWKYVQKVLLAGTRSAAADPRLQKQNKGNDPNINMITRDSSLNAGELEEESILLRNQLVSQLFTLNDPAILHPIIQSIPLLCKSRPNLAPAFITSLTSWTPAALEAKGRPAMVVRAVEKTLRMAMAHLLKSPSLGQFSAQLNDALYRQKSRLEVAWAVEQEAKRVKTKHPLEPESSAQAAKRAKLEVQAGSGKGKGIEVDISGWALDDVIEVVMAGLKVVDLELIKRAFENAKTNLDKMPVLAALFEKEEEILNPLDMDIDDDELLMEETLDEAITFADFTLPPPAPLDQEDKDELLQTLVERIHTQGLTLTDLPIESDGPKTAVQGKEMWMLLLARMGTRGGVRISDIAKDLVWLNEEWYTSKISSSDRYTTSLDSVLTTLLPKIDSKDKSLSPFLASLPELPESVIDKLETLCGDSERSIVGFLALRDLVENRPPIREYALKTLLGLCTFPDRKIRVLAISTVRRWVPDSPMSAGVIDFALGVLRRLANPESEYKYLKEVSSDTVQQHVELAFALSRRHQDLLDNIFRLYPDLSPDIQDTVETMLSPLIQSLGPTDKLVSILKDFPSGADKLVLRVMTVLSAEGATGVVRDVVRGLMSERELDPKFVIPIIGTLEKGEIEKQIPRIVSLLPAERDIVRTAFASLLQRLTPADLLVNLHSTDSSVKSTIEAIGICFSMTSVFRSDVLASALTRIADLPDLPLVFMRTVIQAVTTYKSLVPFVANTVLPKLVARKIWETPALWDGFVRLAKLIAPHSFGALLQLPKEWLKDVVEKQPGLKTGLKGFIGSKPQAKAALQEIFGEA